MEFAITDQALLNPLVPLNGSPKSLSLVQDLIDKEMDLKRIRSAPFQYQMTKCWMKGTPDAETLGSSLSKNLVQCVTQQTAVLINKQLHHESNHTAFQATGPIDLSNVNSLFGACYWQYCIP
jgi:hypothetical protein